MFFSLRRWEVFHGSSNRFRRMLAVLLVVIFLGVKSCSKNLLQNGDGIGRKILAVATVSSRELLEHFKMLYCRREAG